MQSSLLVHSIKKFKKVIKLVRFQIANTNIQKIYKQKRGNSLTIFLVLLVPLVRRSVVLLEHRVRAEAALHEAVHKRCGQVLARAVRVRRRLKRA